MKNRFKRRGGGVEGVLYMRYTSKYYFTNYYNHIVDCCYSYCNPPPNPKIKGLEPNSCMTAFRELIPLNTLFWTGKKLFWEKNDKILHWLAILNEDERKTCWNPGLIFQKNHRLITFTFLGIINRLFRM